MSLNHHEPGALYSIGTRYPFHGRFSPHPGLSGPSLNITLPQLRQRLREIRARGYSGHSVKDENGNHFKGECDPWVIVERTDGKHWKEILKGWRREG